MSALDGVIPGIVDAHAHFFHPGTLPPRNRLPVPGAGFLLRRMPSPMVRALGSLVDSGDLNPMSGLAALATTYGLRDYGKAAAGLATVAGVPVNSVIVADSHWRRRAEPDDFVATTRRELGYLASQPFGYQGLPELGGVVLATDARVPGLGVAEFLDDAAADTAGAGANRVVGVRLRWGRHPDPLLNDVYLQAEILESADFHDVLTTVAECGLVIETLCYSHDLVHVDRIARAYPETPIVIEHLGLPVGAFGPIGSFTGTTAAARAEILGLWRERTAMLAARPNVMVKISGIAGTFLGYGPERSGNIGGQRILADMIGPLVLHLVDRFGPDRVIFGSNAPLDDPNASLGTVVGALIDVLGQRGDHLLGRLFAENARRVYRLPESPPAPDSAGSDVSAESPKE